MPELMPAFDRSGVRLASPVSWSAPGNPALVASATRASAPGTAPASCENWSPGIFAFASPKTEPAPRIAWAWDRPGIDLVSPPISADAGPSAPERAAFAEPAALLALVATEPADSCVTLPLLEAQAENRT